jgi:hypothetical protein
MAYRNYLEVRMRKLLHVGSKKVSLLKLRETLPTASGKYRYDGRRDVDNLLLVLMRARDLMSKTTNITDCDDTKKM